MTAPSAPELVADGLSYPTSLAFDDEGSPWVAEAGLPFGGAPPGGRVWRLQPDGDRQLVAGNLAPPVNGLFHHEGDFFVSVGGRPSQIIRLWPDGAVEVVLEGLRGLASPALADETERFGAGRGPARRAGLDRGHRRRPHRATAPAAAGAGRAAGGRHRGALPGNRFVCTLTVDGKSRVDGVRKVGGALRPTRRAVPPRPA